MNAIEAETRLSNRYGVEATLSDGHVEAAEDALEALAPFRTGVDLDNQATLPGVLLDYVALKALEIKEAREPATARRVSAGDVTVELGSVKGYDPSTLVSPYLKRTGGRS